MRKLIYILFLLPGIFISRGMFAGVEEVSARLNSPSSVSNSVSVEDPHYYTMLVDANYGDDFYNLSVSDYVILGIDQSYSLVVDDFQYRYVIEIIGYDLDGNALAAEEIELNLEHSNEMKHLTKAIHKFSNVHRFSAEIIGVYDMSDDAVSVWPVNVYLETIISVDRVYKFDPASAISSYVHTPVDLDDVDTDADELLISWDFLPGAEYYELEWCYLNDYNFDDATSPWESTIDYKAKSDIEFSSAEFRINSTRIQTGSNSYSIPLIYDHGYIVYRIRGVGRGLSDYSSLDKYLTGVWTDVEFSSGDYADLGEWPALFKNKAIFFTEGHEQNMNWQYSATFAEEGKRKDIVSYYDGALKLRQVVTRTNSNQLSIVGETIYDASGRSTINVLPAPSGAHHLHFHDNFTLNESDEPYSYFDFDVDLVEAVVPCNNLRTPSAMSTFSGASAYYGPTASIGVLSDFIPDAGGYPFTYTQYLNDNSGRVRAVSGLGEELQMGLGRESRFYYTAPAQEELDRLFGSNVGYAKFYKKNITVDPNGQASVQYIDPMGNTIATALVGESPDNLESLKDGEDALSELNNGELTIDLLGKLSLDDTDTPEDNNVLLNSGVYDNSISDVLFSQSSRSVFMDGEDHTYAYSIAGNNLPEGSVDEFYYQNPCLNGEDVTSDINYEFSYILTLRNEGICGNQFSSEGDLFTGTEVKINPLDLADPGLGLDGIYPNGTLSDGSVLSQSENLVLEDIVAGDYLISKELKVDPAAVEYWASRFYDDLVTANSPGCAAQVNIEANVNLEIEAEMESWDCNFTCVDCVIEIAKSFDACYEDLDEGERQQWMALYKECMEPCKSLSLCEIAEDVMLRDFDPNGQYAMVNIGDFITTDDLLSIYHSDCRIKPVELRCSDEGIDFIWQYDALIFYDPLNDGQTTQQETRIYDLQSIDSEGLTLSYDDQGISYIKVNQIKNATDFYNLWQDSWARTLLPYHPEYAYLNWWCGQMQNRKNEYNLKSDDFDNMLISIPSIEQAADFDLVGASCAVVEDIVEITGSSTILPDMFLNPEFIGAASLNLSTITNIIDNDPFFNITDFSGDYIYTEVPYFNGPDVDEDFDGFTRAFTQSRFEKECIQPFLATQNMEPEDADMADLKEYFRIKMADEYFEIDNDQFGLFEFCILTEICSAWYGDDVTTCFDLELLDEISDEFSTTDELSDSQKLTIWKKFVLLYVQSKKDLQNKLMQQGAIRWGAYNACFSNPNFNPYKNRFLHYVDNPNTTSYDEVVYEYAMRNQEAYTAMGFAQNTYITSGQPCNCYDRIQLPSLYAEKIPRFIVPQDRLNATENPDNLLDQVSIAQASSYQATGLCPQAFNVKGLLEGLTKHKFVHNNLEYFSLVTADKLPLHQTNFWLFDLYAELTAAPAFNITGGVVDYNQSYVPCELTSSISGSNLTLTFSETGNPSDFETIVLTNPSISDYPWSEYGDSWNIQFINSFVPTSNSNFTMMVVVNHLDLPWNDGSGYMTSAEIFTGTSSFSLNSCNKGVMLDLLSGQATSGCSSSFNNALVSRINWFLTPSIITSDPGVEEIIESQELFALLCGESSGTITVTSTSTSITVTGCSNSITIYGVPFSSIGQIVSISSYGGVNSISFSYIDSSTGNTETLYNVSITFSAEIINPYLSCYAESECQQNYTQNYYEMYEWMIANTYDWVLNPPTGPIIVSLDPLWSDLGVDNLTFYSALNDPGSDNWIRGITARNADDEALFIVLIDAHYYPGDEDSYNEIQTPFAESDFYLDHVTYTSYDTKYYWYNDPPTPYLGAINIRVPKKSCNLACVPELVVPTTCETGYTNYTNAITAFTSYPTDIPILTEEEFCPCGDEELDPNNPSSVLDPCNMGMGMQYTGVAYVDFIEAMEIDGIEDPYYLTFSEFASFNGKLYYEAYRSFLNALRIELEASNPSLDDIDDLVELDVFTTFAEFAGIDPSMSCILNYLDGITEESLPLNLWINENQCAPSANCYPEDPVYMPPMPIVNPCDQTQVDLTEYWTEHLSEAIIAGLVQDFKADYIKQAMEHVVENFTVTVPDQEYHYTLYYYDQANNLTRTVPPQGVERFDFGDTGAENYTDYEELKQDRDENQSFADRVHEKHGMVTDYSYNVLNQLVSQSSPDGGTTRFWYDRLGRIVASQNAQQTLDDKYSYSRYDKRGRVIEAGVIPSGIALTESILNAPDWPNNYAITRYEVVKTWYDVENFTTPLSSETNVLRNRIAHIAYYDEFLEVYETNYNYATHYKYDIHGNVTSLIQENGYVIPSAQRYKRMDYRFDLISGNVNSVIYQPDAIDQYLHDYIYDADNRLTNVFTSSDGVIWEQDAKYFYYDHGPLARVELGDNKVQGTDYVYNLQGWLKGVNSNALTAEADGGDDGLAGDIHGLIPRDEMGFSLNYYQNDYKARATGLSSGDKVWLNNGSFGNDLYNGNIKSMSTSIGAFMFDPELETDNGMPNTFEYGYDQLNRLISADHRSWAASMPTTATDNKWKTTYKYDQNGNMLSLERRDKEGEVFDNFTYNYDYTTDDWSSSVENNRLNYVYDAGGSSTTSMDHLQSQSDGNYTYDAIGNLISDLTDEIENIEWTVSGKIRGITRTEGSDKPDLEFLYDASGQRVCKIVKPRVSGDPGPYHAWKKTWYIRDAQGNVMSTYDERLVGNFVSGDDPCSFSGYGFKHQITLTESHIYGSSRLGVENRDLIVYSRGASVNVEMNFPSYSEPCIPELDTENFSQTIGDKQFELSNHLGNVLVVVSDLRIAMDEDDEILYYIAQVNMATDYYPFGMVMDGRTFSTETYRYGFNGQEKDDEVSGEGNTIDFTFRVHDTRLGRFLSVDPLSNSYPWNSPYAFAENRVIDGIDLEGLEYIHFNEARIEVTYGGEIQLKLSNFSEFYQEAWHNRNKMYIRTGKIYTAPNGTQYIGGVPLTIATISQPNIPMDPLYEDIRKKGFVDDSVVEEFQANQKQAVNNSKIRKDGGLHRSYNATKHFYWNAKFSKGFAALEAASIIYQGYEGYKFAFWDKPAYKEDTELFESQLNQLEPAMDAIRNFLANNSVNPDVLGSKIDVINLYRFVLTGETVGDDNRLFDLGESILNSVGMNDNPKIDKRFNYMLGKIRIDISSSDKFAVPVSTAVGN